MNQRIRQRVWSLVRWSVTIGALVFVVHQITWKDRLRTQEGPLPGWCERSPSGVLLFHADDGRTYPVADEGHVLAGFWTLLKGVDRQILAAVFLVYPVSVLFVARRWQWLLRTHDLDPGFRESLRLTWVGLLANHILPGSTGGDLVKGWCIYRRTPGKRMAAVMTVLMDRLLGLVSLMLVGGIALLTQSRRPELEGPARFVWWCLLVAFVSGIVFFSGRIRRWLHVARLIELLPFQQQVRKLDQSVFHYRHHAGAVARCVGISLVLHLWTIGCVYGLGLALKMGIPLVNYYVLLPIIFTGSAFFPSVAGLGVMEGLFQQLFTLVDREAGSSAVALCVLLRVLSLAASLPGLWPMYSEFSAHGVPQLSYESEVPTLLPNDDAATASPPSAEPQMRTPPAGGPTPAGGPDRLPTQA